jgi:hypothetical protein
LGNILAEQYHYDKDGKYQGKTSDTPPSSGDGCGAIILIFIIIALIGKCSGGSSSSSSAPAEAPQTYSTPAEPAQHTAPAPQPYEPPSTAPESNPGEEFEFEGK